MQKLRHAILERPVRLGRLSSFIRVDPSRFAVIDAALGEILTTASKMDWLVEHGERYLKPESRSTNWMMIYKSAKVHYEPLGVVAAIVSWNYRAFAFYALYSDGF